MEKVAQLYRQGQDFEAKGHTIKAINSYYELVSIDAEHDKAYANIARLSYDMGWVPKALENYALAMRANPEESYYKRQFVHISQLYEVQRPNDALKFGVYHAMQEKGIDHYPLARLWMSLLAVEPSFKPLFDISYIDDYEDFKEKFESLENHDFFTGDFFLASLNNMTAYHRSFEFAFKNLRRLLLENLGNSKFQLAKNYASLVAAMAQYCFFTEYVFSQTDEEIKVIDALEKKALAGKITEEELALYACYRPLAGLKNNKDIAEQFKSSETIGDVITHQLLEIYELAKIAKTIPVLTPVDNEVSKQVQSMYEFAPYPRWNGYTVEPKHPSFEGDSVGEQILIAGCGTGQDAIEMAEKYKDAHVTAIDLSLSSLSYAQKKAKEFGVKNITFGQADILKVDTLGKEFDFIVSVGVIHHMEDPAAGLSKLKSVLKPGGRLRLALYSKIERRYIIEGQDLIKERRKDKSQTLSTNEEIREFRANIEELMSPEAQAYILRSRDFYIMSECRDMLFHVQEHNIDLNDLDKMLHDADLKFLGFYIPALTQTKYIIRNFWDYKAKNLKRWAKFESKNPGIFAGMYVFWVEKN